MLGRMKVFPTTTTGLPLSLGGAPLGNLFAAMDDDAADAVLQAAWASGCRTFDTAPHYGNGLSEHRFGRALRRPAANRDDWALSSKVGRLLLPNAEAPADQNSYVGVLPFEQVWDYSAAGMRRSVQDSLQRLGLARLDAVFVHDCDRDTHGSRYPAVLAQVVQEALPELELMKREGLVRHVGLGVNDVQVCLDVLAQADLDCLLLAGRYTLIDHTALHELLPLCQTRGVRVAIGGVYNSGILATGVRAGQAVRFNYAEAPKIWVDRTAAVEALCERFAVPLRAAALQFAAAHPAVETVLIGAQTASQWDDALAMLAHPIDARFWQALVDEKRVPASAPLPAPVPASQKP